MLDNNTKERVRYHMGYLNTQPAASISFGVPVPLQTLFLLESAMNDLINSAAEDRVRRLVTILDNIECKMVEWQEYLSVSSVDDIKIRPDNIDQLEHEYCRWAARLSDELGAPLYPGSQKFASLFMTGKAGSIPVRS